MNLRTVNFKNTWNVFFVIYSLFLTWNRSWVDKVEKGIEACTGFM